MSARKYQPKARPNPWGDVYNRRLSKGEDHGYAAFKADEAQDRWAKDTLERCPHCDEPIDTNAAHRTTK